METSESPYIKYFERTKERTIMSMRFSGTIYDQIQDLEKRVSNLERQSKIDEGTRKLEPNDDSKAGIRCRTCGIIFE